MIRYFKFTIICVFALSLQACSVLGIATGAAAVTGISAAQEGGISRAVSDTTIKLKINEAWFQYDVEAFRKLGTTINQGRVLITGVVQNPEHRVEAVRLAWQVPGVDQVMNEVRVANSAGISGFVKDKWITSRLRGALTFDRGVQSINYSIDTVQGVVYLMGVAQNQAELNLVTEKARTISGVKQVISYVKLAGEPLNNARSLNTQNNVQNNVSVQNTNVSNVPVYDGPAQLEPQAGSNIDLGNNPNNSMGASQSSIYENPIYNVPNGYQPSAQEQGIQSDEGYAVPARRVPENAPNIADQYYN